MKDKFLPGICFLLVVINVVGCRKKSTFSSDQSVQQTTASNQDGTEQVSLGTPDKSATEKLIAQESASAIVVSEAQGDETEYFALFMEGKKVGYAIQRREVEGEKVTTSVELKITLSRTGIPVSVQTQAITFETVDGKPLGFELDQAMGMMSSKTTATIDEQGKVKVKTGQQEVEFE